MAEDEKKYDNSPGGLARRWRDEIDASLKWLKDWRQQGDKIDKRYRDDRENDQAHKGDTRWNLFSADTETKESILYGQTPRISVSRRFADPGDDVARVAGEMLERHLNTDVERDEDTFPEVLGYAIQDRLIPGICLARVRYEVETESEQVEAITHPETGEEMAEGYSREKKTSEEVEVDYIHWKDFLWSPARIWREVRWVAFRAELSREDLVRMFGDQVGNAIPLNCGRKNEKNGNDSREKEETPWHRAEVWEIWDKASRTVYHLADGWPTILFPVNNPEGKDPLGLKGFFPCPRPVMANVTTSKCIPRPDFVLAQDLYDEIDRVSTRITLLERAIAAKGLYDKAMGDVAARLLNGENKNELFPVANWPALAERGGIKGLIDWLPLEQIVNALTVLREYRSELIEAKHQVTGMADIMRGQATTAGASATEQAIKAKFGSVRMEKLQKQFAKFASDIQKLKAEIIAKHFDPQTIIERSNVMSTPDAPLAQQAVALIKSGKADYRIEVKPEAISLQDFSALKSERAEVVEAMGSFLTSASAVQQAVPGAMPFMLEILQWFVAGLRGSSEIEGVLDRAVVQAQQAAQQPQQQAPDPKLAATQLKGQLDIQKEQTKLQADLTRIQAEVQADASREATQARYNTQEALQKAVIARSLKPQPMGPGQGGM